MGIYIAPSILAADVTKLGEEVINIEKAGDKWLHIDIMDGHFVPNLSYSPQIVKGLRPISNMFFDVHLMISEPEKYIQAFADAGADLITIHAEVANTKEELKELADMIHKAGVKAGVSIKPKTPVSVLDGVLEEFELILVMSVEPGFGGQSYIEKVNPKITELRKMADKISHHIDIEVDGGIKAENIHMPVQAGANILVAGSSVFGKTNSVEAVKELHKIAERSVK